MSIITKESIADTIEGLELLANRGIQSVHIDMAIAGMRRLLASLEAEPVAWRHFQETPTDGGYWIINDYKPNCSGVEPLYTAPPAAPVSVPAAMEMDDDFDSAFEHGKAVGWNAYRAAMLQGAKNAESPTTMQTAPALDYSPKIAESPAGINQGKSEPVTTACKLPEPIKDNRLNSGAEADDYYSGYQAGWNECLESVQVICEGNPDAK
ncbi:hypothetical protein [Enterobacter hormaechei]|uniref:hypothetical protein n=1 Tax=Enterobacter hormaechei TaxID=158836 RepID=UPI002FF9316C